MGTSRKVVLLTLLMSVLGCRRPAGYAPPETPLPPNTVLLSGMMRELSAQPGFTDALLAQIDDGGKKGPALLTPKLIDELRKRILGRDWEGLDRFPGWTMREVNPTVDVAGKVLAKNEKLQSMAAVHPGSPAPPLSAQQARQWIDLGNFSLGETLALALNDPGLVKDQFKLEGAVTKLGAGVDRGDGPSGLVSKHGDSQLLAEAMNRLAVNKLDGAKPATVTLAIKTYPKYVIQAVMDPPASSAEELMQMLQSSGHAVSVTDTRYFANFGHLHYKDQDVMMPFWINTQIAVPGSGGIFRKPRALLVPVSHAEYEWHIRGPLINADVSYYFGIDGKSEWRTMDTQDQAWVLKRDAHTYTGEQAVEVTRLVSLITVAMMHQHAARPELPFGGYYALGVCQDGVSAIEKKMTGHSTLFPNTADSALFDDPRDAEVNALIAAIPKDRAGANPPPERVFGSLPTADLNAVTIPGLADDLRITYDAWQQGKLERTHGMLFYIALDATVAAIGACIAFAIVRRRKQSAY